MTSWQTFLLLIIWKLHTHKHTHTHTHTHTQNGELGLEKCYPKNTVVVVSVSQYDAFILSCLNQRSHKKIEPFFCIGLETQLNGPALGVLKHHYIANRIRELLIGKSRFLIYNLLNQLLYYTV